MHFDTAVNTAAKIRSGETTSVAVTEGLLERIRQLQPTLKPFVTICADEAITAAERADQQLAESGPLSPLHGVPIAIKDLLDTAGIQTTYGMSIHQGNIPTQDATVVAKLKAAGTIMLGKLKLTEGAYARHHPAFEVPINPWNKDCWTGVSSSGSGVATAAGLCFASIGSDTGGSIRFPSAANGLVGLKPTWGRVSRAGALPLAYTLDHMGPMTRSVADAAAMLQIISGVDPRDPSCSHLPVEDYLAAANTAQAIEMKNLRIGVDWRYCEEGIEPELGQAIREAITCLTELGAEVIEVVIPHEDVSRAWPVTCAVETAHAHQATYPGRESEYGAIGDLIAFGRSLPASAYLEQELVRRNFKAALNQIYTEVDMLICPSMSFTALPKEGSPEADSAEQDLAKTLRFTAPFDFSGNPTLSLPWSPGASGIPHSVQLVARDFEESLLVKVGQTLESAGGYGDQHPNV